MKVFPFAFIWRAMLSLDGKISSDELNRAIFKVANDEDLVVAIESIGQARRSGDSVTMGPETVTGSGKNDRIIPWMSLASFGWTLIADKPGAGGAGFYEIRPQATALLKEASTIRHRHRDFASVEEYVTHISYAAAMPKDVR